jgi:RNA 3'-terminal phosphate cyclase (ATP)
LLFFSQNGDNANVRPVFLLVIEVDGSFGEGGGQILRTSVTLAALTGQAVEIVNIRGKRSKPGLQPQHLMAVRAAGEVCGAEMKGDAVGSMFLSFRPAHPPKAGQYRFDIGTAGATTLVAQTVLLPLAHAKGESRVTVIGGTHNPHAPTADYLRLVYLPTLRGLGLEADVAYPRAGYYPVGGGVLEVSVRPSRLEPSRIEGRGAIKKTVAMAVTSSLREHVARRGLDEIRRRLGDRRVDSKTLDLPAHSAGAATIIVQSCEGVLAGFSSIGVRGKPMEKVAAEAANAFLEWEGRLEACDEHLADQLVLPAVLAEGESRWTTTAVTEHLRTVMWLARKFVPIECQLEERPDGSGSVRVVSPGIRPGH